MIKIIASVCFFIHFSLYTAPPSLLMLSLRFFVKQVMDSTVTLEKLNKDLLDDMFNELCKELFCTYGVNSPLMEYLKTTKQWFILPSTMYSCEGALPIHSFAAVNDPEGVNKLIENGSAADALTTSHQTPLHYAAAHDAAEVLWLLPGYMSDVSSYIDQQDDEGRTALHIAVHHLAKTAVLTLLSLGASVDVVDKEGRTPLCYALFSMNKELFCILLRHAHLNSTQGALRKNIQTFFAHVCKDHGEEELNHRGVCAALGLCASILPSNLSTYITRWKTLSLALAAQNDDIPLIRALIMVGISPNMLTRVGPPLLTAAENGKKSAVEEILDHGGSVVVRDSAKNTALHVAVTHPPILKLLLDKGAPVDVTNKLGETPLIRACALVRPETISEVVKLLLAAHANPQHCSIKGDTPLRLASNRGLTSVVGQLLTAGAEPNYVRRKKRKKMGTLPLHAAASNGHADVADILLQAGADPTIRTRTHFTPSRLASRSGFPQLAAQLLTYQQMFLKQRTGL